MKGKTKTPSLVLTGQRRGVRYEVQIRGRRVCLPPRLFGALLALVWAKASGRELARISPTTVCRMRREIGECTDMATAKALIVEAGGSEYFLAVDAEEIAFYPLFRTVRMPARYPAMKWLKAALLRMVAEVPKPSDGS